jgi:hypothetical protein
MKEHFQWGDTDGNNGYSYDDFSPAELQAAWDIQGMSHVSWNDMGARSGKVEVRLDYYGKPYIGLFPNEIDAKTIKSAIEIRSKLIEEQGQLNPPTIEQIRARAVERRRPSEVQELKSKIQAILNNK